MKKVTVKVKIKSKVNGSSGKPKVKTPGNAKSSTKHPIIIFKNPAAILDLLAELKIYVQGIYYIDYGYKGKIFGFVEACIDYNVFPSKNKKLLCNSVANLIGYQTYSRWQKTVAYKITWLETSVLLENLVDKNQLIKYR